MKKIINIDVIFCVILFLFSFLHVSYGVDLADTSYSLGNYENMQNMGLMWTVATLGANIVGKGLTLLPGGHTWIGMNVYATLMLFICVMAIYIFLRKYMPGWIIFLGEILALSLCWCPKVILYNYLTYIMLSVIVMVLIRALEKKSKILMGVAGGLLAVNVMVRFPNIVEILLIVLVWTWGYFEKRGVKEIIFDTLACTIGFLLGLILVGSIITGFFGEYTIRDMITSLMNMSANNPGYSPLSMMKDVLFMYQTTIVSVFYLGLIAIVSLIAALVFRKMKWMKVAVILGEIVVLFLYLVWEYKIGFYNFNYYSYSSFQHFAILFLEAVMMISLLTVVIKHDVSIEEKMFAVVALIIIIITPIGSNNALFPIYNNLFLVAPIGLWLFWKRLFAKKKQETLLNDKGLIQWFPIRVMSIILGMVVIIQCVGFGVFFVFASPGFPNKNDVKVTGNPKMIGMHMSADRAEEIEKLTEFAIENHMVGKECIIFGELPGISYILDMPCAISHTWPDLGSYSLVDMETDIEKLKDTPIIFVNDDLYPNILEIESENKKASLLAEFMGKHNYKKEYSFGGIAVYIPQKD